LACSLEINLFFKGRSAITEHLSGIIENMLVSRDEALAHGSPDCLKLPKACVVVSDFFNYEKHQNEL